MTMTAPETLIEVYCESDAHAGKRVCVVAFKRFDGEWRPLKLKRGRRAWWDALTPPRGTPPIADEDEVYLMRCKLCGFDLQRRRDAVDPVLDTLEAHDQRSISLSALAGRLR